MTEKKPYTITELCGTFNRSSTTIYRKIKKYKLALEKNYVNGRRVNLVYLDDEQFEALKKEIELFNEPDTSTLENDLKNINNSELGNNANTSEKRSTEIPDQSINTNTSELSKLVGEVVSLSQLVQKQSTTIERLSKELGEKDAKLMLLEDSEKRKNNDYFELKAKLETIEKRRWWHFKWK